MIAADTFSDEKKTARVNSLRKKKKRIVLIGLV